MKIGLITDSLDYQAAGIGRYIRNLVTNLTKVDRKNEYVLIHEKEIDDELYRGHIQHIVIPSPHVPLGRELRKITLGRALRQYNFDVVHDLAQVGPFFSAQPYVAIETIYDLSPMRYPQFVTTANRWRNTIGVRLILNNLDAIITISETSKREIVEQYHVDARKIHVTTLAHDPERFHPLELDSQNNQDFLKRYHIDTPYFLFVGTIEPRKNLTTLIAAFNDYRHGGSMAQLFIIGRLGWKYQAIEQAMKTSPFADDIRWLAKVEDIDLPFFYANARALIFPSWHEGFGLPVVEAMACRCPIICSDIPVIREIAGPAALYFDPHRHELCTEAMRTVNTEVKRGDLIAARDIEIQKYSWERCARQTLKVYEQYS
ncbi:MAG: glycosyltransferase family 1 protein [Patescibacteria group bacterium]